MDDKRTTIKAFVQDEMKRRGIVSNREFAELCGVGHTTINRILDERDGKAEQPAVETLIKIADATGHSPITLLQLAYPGKFETSVLSPSTLVIAERIEKSPDHIQQAIRAIILGSGVTE
jgi:transcriptional regulator with XRE-family HTH domain